MPMMEVADMVPLSSDCRKYVMTMTGSTRLSIMRFSLLFSSSEMWTSWEPAYLATSLSMRL